MKQSLQNLELPGRSLSRGLAMGKAYVHEDIMHRDYDLYEIDPGQVEAELSRVKQAIGIVREDLRGITRRVEKDVGEAAAKVFEAQEAILRDPMFLKEVEGELRTKLVNAEEAVKHVLRRFSRGFEESDNALFQQRADDIKDLSRRLMHSLVGVKAHSLENMPAGSVLVAERLLPSDTVFLSRKSTVAAVMEHGGLASHAALLTREMGIPAVAGIKDCFSKIRDGDTLLVDGYSGTVTINPDESTEAEFRNKMERESLRQVEAYNRSKEPAVTHDDVTIRVMANVGCLEDAQMAKANGADGIGLFRLEQLYLYSKAPPSRSDLLRAIKPCVELFGRNPVVVRLLDAGADKVVPFLNLATEENPSLGRRGVRILLEYPDLLRPQLEVLVLLAQEHDVRVLVPMVTVAEEMQKIREMLEQTGERIGAGTMPLLGAMIETPASALCASDLARYADFFSIGTNDLTQYTMAAGRENDLVNRYFREKHPAVMRLVGLVAAEAGGKSVEVCGELAGDTAGVPQLIKFGVRTLSVAPSLIPTVKDTVRMTEIGEGQTAEAGTKSGSGGSA